MEGWGFWLNISSYKRETYTSLAYLASSFIWKYKMAIHEHIKCRNGCVTYLGKILENNTFITALKSSVKFAVFV